MTLSPRLTHFVQSIGHYWAFVPYEIASFLVILGSHMLLYNDWALHSVVKDYFHRGTPVWGDVTACEEVGPATRRMRLIPIPGHYATVVYHSKVLSTPVRCGRFFGTPKSHQRPSVLINERGYLSRKFVRKFKTRQSHLRGDALELLVLPRRPSSGMLVSTLEEMRMNYPWCKCIVLLLPSLGLLTLIIAAAWTVCQESFTAAERPSLYIALVGSLGAQLLISRTIADWQFQMVRHKSFESAIAIPPSTRNSEPTPSHSGSVHSQYSSRQPKSEPLLDDKEQRDDVPLSPIEGFSRHIRPVLMKNLQLV
jgi:hypothetical protein